MAMSRKDYNAVAAEFAESYAELAKRDYLSDITRDFMASQTDQIAYRMARAFLADNPRFDAKRFLLACGMRADLAADYAYMASEHVYQAKRA